MKTLPQEYYTMLWDLQSVDFVLVELTLYLDTHPGDVDATEQFNQFALLRREMVAAFEAKFGPLMQFGHSLECGPLAWSESPWPWQV